MFTGSNSSSTKPGQRRVDWEQRSSKSQLAHKAKTAFHQQWTKHLLSPWLFTKVVGTRELSHEQQFHARTYPNHISLTCCSFLWSSLFPSSQQPLSLPCFHDLHLALISSSYPWLCVRSVLAAQLWPQDPTQSMPANELLCQGEAVSTSLSLTLPFRYRSHNVRC